MIKVNGKKLEYITYPNGEWGVKNLNDTDFVIARNTDIDNKIEWTTDKDFAKELIVLISIKKSFSANCSLHIDYLPLSREDKTENGRINLFYSVFQLLDDAFQRITFDTLHNVSIYEVMNEHYCVNIEKLKKQLTNILNNIKTNSRILFVFPDKSAEERYLDDILEFDFDIKKIFATARKSRNKENGTINNEDVFSIEDINEIKSFLPTHVIMVDDLISFGGSFLRVAKEIDKILGYHPKTILSVYGNENQKLSDEFNKYIDEIVWEKDINFN